MSSTRRSARGPPQASPPSVVVTLKRRASPSPSTNDGSDATAGTSHRKRRRAQDSEVADESQESIPPVAATGGSGKIRLRTKRSGPHTSDSAADVTIASADDEEGEGDDEEHAGANGVSGEASAPRRGKRGRRARVIPNGTNGVDATPEADDNGDNTQDAEPSDEEDGQRRACLAVLPLRKGGITHEKPSEVTAPAGAAAPLSLAQDVVLSEEDVLKIRTVVEHLYPTCFTIPTSTAATEVNGAPPPTTKKVRSSKKSTAAAEAALPKLGDRVIAGASVRDVHSVIRNLRTSLSTTDPTESTPATGDETAVRLVSLTFLQSLLDDIVRTRTASAPPLNKTDDFFKPEPATDAVRAEETEDAILLGNAPVPIQVKSESSEDLPGEQHTADTSSGTSSYYAAAMILPGSNLYYTSAVWLKDEEAAKLELGSATIVRIEHMPTTLPSTASTQPARVPSLGERLLVDAEGSSGAGDSRSRRRNKARADLLETARLDRCGGRVVRPQGVNYGPYSSFAPSYDSGRASLSFGAYESIRGYKEQRDARRRLALRIVDDVDDYDVEEGSDEEHAAETVPAQISSATSEPLALFGDLVDDDFRAGFAALEAQEQVDAKLAHSAARLVSLHDAQIARLAATGAGDSATLRGLLRTGASAKEGIAVDPEEQIAADQVLETLGDLVERLPPSRVLPGNAVSSMRALPGSAALDPGLLDGHPREGFWGTLADPAVSLLGARSSVRRERDKASQPSLQIIRDNWTVELSNSDVTLAVVDAAGEESKQTLGLVPKVGNTTQVEKEDEEEDESTNVIASDETRSRSLLDRFAQSRAYSPADADRHDRTSAAERARVGPVAGSSGSGPMPDSRYSATQLRRAGGSGSYGSNTGTPRGAPPPARTYSAPSNSQTPYSQSTAPPTQQQASLPTYAYSGSGQSYGTPRAGGPSAGSGGYAPSQQQGWGRGPAQAFNASPFLPARSSPLTPGAPSVGAAGAGAGGGGGGYPYTSQPPGAPLGVSVPVTQQYGSYSQPQHNASASGYNPFVPPRIGGAASPPAPQQQGAHTQGKGYFPPGSGSYAQGGQRSNGYPAQQ